MHCPAKRADQVAALLGSFSASGVEFGYHPFAAGREEEQEQVAIYLEQSPELEATAAAITGQLTELQQQLSITTPWEVEREPIVDCDWNAAWKKQFKPLAVAPGLVIKPSWEDYRPQPGEQVIEMDPGMAFGTGHHASTRLALGLLREIYANHPPPSALDVGCGTGILAMAAALWGCPLVLAIDNDPQAVEVARQNFAANRLAGQIEASGKAVGALTETFAVVLANITSDVLLHLATDLHRATAGGGHLILAGILAGEQEAAIKEHFQRLGFQLLAASHQEEWAACLLHKPRNPKGQQHC